jgi:hypothetical protein
VTNKVRAAGRATDAAAPTGWRSVFPPAQWLASYQPKWLKKDAIAGVT